MAFNGMRLKKVREQKRLTQMEVAKLLGISNGTLSGYERNYRDPDTDTLEKMATLFEVSTDYLLGLTDDPHPLSDIKQTDDNESLFFYDMDNITPEEAQALKEHLEFLRWKAKQVNNNEEKK